MYRFMNFINNRYSRDFADYKSLYQWSIDNMPDFWGSIWEFGDIKASQPYDQVVDDPYKMPGARWFKGARLNFAENLLRYRDDHTALIFKGENRDSVKITYSELYEEVAKVAESLKAAGVKTKDRVVGFMPNIPETIIAMLACTSIGATWSSCSPDFGIKGVLDRFGQVKPKVLFTADGYFFKGKTFDSLKRISNILKQLPSIEKVVVIPFVKENPDISDIKNSVYYNDFKSSKSGLEIEFNQLPFDHPLYIMYSSGATGLPKCMVQGAGGILLHGGSDLNGCFALGNPMTPVYAGELQCRGLAMKVEALDENGKSVINRQGELVCKAAFPSMPVYFWNDPDNKKYYSAYFEPYPGIWTHGDFIEINDRGGGGYAGKV
jgi:acetoacetyl-CoA synthetase